MYHARYCASKFFLSAFPPSCFLEHASSLLPTAHTQTVRYARSTANIAIGRGGAGHHERGSSGSSSEDTLLGTMGGGGRGQRGAGPDSSSGCSSGGGGREEQSPVLS